MSAAGSWTVGALAWFVHEHVVTHHAVHALDPKRNLVGIVDWSEANNVGWYDAGNVFPTVEAAVSQLRTWQRETLERAIADERADLRSWLGQQAAKANRDAKKAAVASRLLGMAAAFKEAADHLKPAKVKGHLKRKRAARAVGKEVSK